MKRNKTCLAPVTQVLIVSTAQTAVCYRGFLKMPSAEELLVHSVHLKTVILKLCKDF